MTTILTNAPKTRVKVYIMTQQEFQKRLKCTTYGCKVPLPPKIKIAGTCEHHTHHTLDELIYS